MRTLILILLIPLLTGCIAGKQQYDSYLAAEQARDQQMAVEQQARHQRFAEMAKACNGDPVCIREVAREATLSDAFASVSAGAGGRGQIQQFQVQAHPATAALTSLGGIALQQGIQGAVQIRQSDNARDVSINANTMQAQTQQSAIGLGIAAVNGATTAVTNIGNVLPNLAPTQSYTSGGPMSLGNMNIGDQAGRDNVRDGSQVGHSGPINTGTQNTGGVMGSGQVGNGRQNAPGPFGNIGPQCQGDGCQPVNPPPPVDPEGE